MIARKHPIRLRAVLLALAVRQVRAVPLVRRLALQQALAAHLAPAHHQALAVLRAAKRFTQATIQTRQRQI